MDGATLDDKLAAIERLLKGLRFANVDQDDRRDLEQMRLLLAESRLEVVQLRARLGDAP